MNDVYEPIRQSLSLAAQRYRAAEAGGRLSARDWQENVRLLKPITDQLQKEAQTRETQCRGELDQRTGVQTLLLADRARCYSEVQAEKDRLSGLDSQIIALTKEIGEIGKEVEEKRRKIEENQEELRRAKEKQKDWNIAFWCTFWIPFANIGTACKKADVDNEYEAKAKVLGQEIEALRNRALGLTRDLTVLRVNKQEKDEASAELTRKITTIEGRVSQITAEINSLSSQINLWRTILQVCREADTRLAHADGDLTAVRKCFEKLLEVEKMLQAPTTTRFVLGRTCVGTSLRAGDSLRRDQYLVSPNRKFIAVLDGTNDLVVCNSEGELWSSGTQGARGRGCLCLDGQGPARLLGTDQDWTSKRPGVASLVMQDDGNLVAYGADGKSLWASDTFTYANVDSMCFQTQAQ